jgi:hypothetical protein
LYPLGLFFIFLAALDFMIVSVQTALNFQLMFDRQSFHLILLLLSIGLNMFFIGLVLELVNRVKGRVDKIQNEWPGKE